MGTSLKQGSIPDAILTVRQSLNGGKETERRNEKIADFSRVVNKIMMDLTKRLRGRSAFPSPLQSPQPTACLLLTINMISTLQNHHCLLY